MSDINVCCRACGQKGLTSILRLGDVALANALRTEVQLPDPEPRYPLDLAFCDGCSLVQITETVPAPMLFSDYPYFSTVSDAVVENAASIARRMVRWRGLDATSLVIEAASNDGYLLQHYATERIPILGIEPARNVAELAIRERGVPTMCTFFSDHVARQLAADGRTADVFHANNVLAHVGDLNGFVEGIRHVLKPDGIAVIEVPYVRDMVERCEFDTIYHEHLCYFSVTALVRLFRRHHLEVSDVERLPIHGGSLRIFATLEGAVERCPSVSAFLAEEHDLEIDRPAFYRHFAERVEQLKVELRELLSTLRREGHRIAAYGASAKGSTLLSYCELGPDVIDFVVDRSPHKQGRYMPGVPLLIREPARLLEDMPGFVLLLTWNFADEIMAQQAEYLRRGGRFIVPVPQPAVATA